VVVDLSLRYGNVCEERNVTTRRLCDISLWFCATTAVINEQMCQAHSILGGARPQRIVCEFTAVNITMQNFKNLFEKYIYQSVLTNTFFEKLK